MPVNSNLHTPFPRSDLEKRVPLSYQFASIDGKIYPFGFHTILRSGDKAKGEQESGGKDLRHKNSLFGQLFDIKGNKLTVEGGSDYIFNDIDFSSLIKGRDQNLYMVSRSSKLVAMLVLKPVKTRSEHS